MLGIQHSNNAVYMMLAISVTWRCWASRLIFIFCCFLFKCSLVCNKAGTMNCENESQIFRLWYQNARDCYRKDLVKTCIFVFSIFLNASERAMNKNSNNEFVFNSKLVNWNFYVMCVIMNGEKWRNWWCRNKFWFKRIFISTILRRENWYE